MKLIIDIDENLYNRVISPEHLICFTDPMRCEQAIKEGTLLEKHDEKVIKETVESIWGKPPYIEHIDKLIDKCMETLFDDTLDKIRAEIEQVTEEESKHDKKWAQGLKYALKIIDKYRDKGDKE